MARLGLLAVLLLASPSLAAPKAGFTPKVAVAGPTRVDWTFCVSNRSLAEPPAEFLGNGYDSAKQTYDLYLPDRKDPKKPIGAILFINAGDDAGGWKEFEPVCTKLGFAFVGVRGAGNGVPGPKRVRIVLDCFDDVRKQVPLDPDRTYLSGFSGGARMACAIGMSQPEYFGGVLPLAAGGELRDEPWLRHRAIDRLSAAFVTGTKDFNYGEIFRWKGPQWKDTGVRTKVWVLPNGGHAIPPSATLAEAVAWLEEGKDKRAALAKKYPASRAADAPPSRDALAKLLLAEGKEKTGADATRHAGLMLLKGVFERFPDTDGGKAARTVLEEYEGRKEKPWEATDLAEQKKYLAAEARGLSDYVLNGIPAESQYAKAKPDMAKRALSIWELLIQDDPNSPAAAEGKKLLAELSALAKKK